MKKFHIVKIHFQRRSSKVTQEWLNKRYNFFHLWTGESLRRQKHQDFRIWFCFEPGMQEMAHRLQVYCPSAVYTFGEHFTQSVNLSPRDRADLERSSHVYMTRIDSDDLYAPDALSILDGVTSDSDCEVAIFARGYMTDIRTKQLTCYHNESSPFHCFMMKRDFFTARKHIVEDHSKVKDAYKVHRMPDWKFTVLIHDDNFLSTIDYRRDDSQRMPVGWKTGVFMQMPIVFDVDDYGIGDPLPSLLKLRETYPQFKCTLFGIPGKLKDKDFKRLEPHKDWIEVAVHGIEHEPLDEMLKFKRADLAQKLRELDPRFVKGFRPPGWYLTDDVIGACNDAGLWVAMHLRDRARGLECAHGHYTCDERWPASHWHTHDVCDNWLDKAVPDLMKLWPKEQKFVFVSEAVLK